MSNTCKILKITLFFLSLHVFSINVSQPQSVSQSRVASTHRDLKYSSLVLLLLSDGTFEGLQLTSMGFFAWFPWSAVAVRARCLIS